MDGESSLKMVGVPNTRILLFDLQGKWLHERLKMTDRQYEKEHKVPAFTNLFTFFRCSKSPLKKKKHQLGLNILFVQPVQPVVTP